MKNLILILMLGVAVQLNAQFQYDYGIKFGASNYLGDIGGKEMTRRDFVYDMHLKQATRYSAGGYFRYKYSKRFAIAANLDYLRITDYDRWSTNLPRRARNMNFRNDIIELGARAELTIFYDNDVGNRGYYNPDFKWYVFAGLAGFYHNPKAQVEANGELLEGGFWFPLRPWMTEGQDRPYSPVSIAIPMGTGFYFTFKKEWRVGWEFSWRTLFTDYLDDVSTFYAKPNTDDPLADVFVNQATYQGLLDELNGTDAAKESEFYPLNINNFRYWSPDEDTKRGDPTNNDSYLTTQITVGKVIKGRSKFYKAKYSVKNTRNVRRSRAKF